MIHEVFPDSPAAKSNVLKPGFRINRINETELKSLTHEAAMEVLRSAQDKVRLLAVAYFFLEIIVQSIMLHENFILNLHFVNVLPFFLI